MAAKAVVEASTTDIKYYLINLLEELIRRVRRALFRTLRFEGPLKINPKLVCLHIVCICTHI